MRDGGVREGDPLLRAARWDGLILAAIDDAGVTWVLVAGWIDELDDLIELAAHP